jgi:hypothetical protein
VVRERLREICNGRTVIEIAEEMAGNGRSKKKQNDKR